MDFINFNYIILLITCAYLPVEGIDTIGVMRLKDRRIVPIYFSYINELCAILFFIIEQHQNER